ncbi:hypothetical protein SCHPADRAFT_253367 [Schizopora paradoxa]|uniref:Pentatricopeptide repeat-containing protein n=1 Tax=Schizopora paradoxa TaxID=27342 RepID=A0A0H2SF62_9AGAM|nr:hypothetical protein SCHPADRAFT_253367 [Schizopora paradoxa]
MLRALSPGLLTVHGKRRAYDLVLSRCILQKPMVDAVRKMETFGAIRSMHRGDHVQAQVATTSRIVQNPFGDNHASSSKALVLENAPKGQWQTSSKTVVKLAHYIRQRSPEKRMLARIRIVTSHAHTTKRHQRLAKLLEPYIPERKGKGKEKRVPSKGAAGKVYRPDPVVAGHYETLRTSKDVNELWEAYQAVLLSFTSPPPPDYPADAAHTPTSATSPSTPPHLLLTPPILPTAHVIPLSILRRLSRVLASTQPRTRSLFLRHLSVLSALSARGDHIPLWAWNALIDCAGKGWRRTRVAEYKTALSVYNDMISSGGGRGRIIPAVNDEESGEGEGGETDQGTSEGRANGKKLVDPDIVTFTTLLNIAVETRSESAVRHAFSLLKNSGLAPTEITHLVQLKDRQLGGGLRAVRNVYRSLESDGHAKLSIGGLNAVLWTISRDGRMDVLVDIYRILERNVADHMNDQQSAEEDSDDSSVVEGIPVHRSLIPNSITYSILIQSFSYHGQLLDALNVFRDMLYRAEASDDPSLQPSLVIYRALFRAFARHAPKRSNRGSSQLRSFPSNDGWSEENLDLLFGDFLQLPGNIKANDRTVYWIMSSYIRLCGKNDPKVSEVFRRLSERVNIKNSGRLKYLREKYGLPAVAIAQEIVPRR